MTIKTAIQMATNKTVTVVPNMRSPSLSKALAMACVAVTYSIGQNALEEKWLGELGSLQAPCLGTQTTTMTCERGGDFRV